MARYKDWTDIPYLKFMDYAEEIKDRSDDLLFVSEKVLEYFYPGINENESELIEEFAKALNTPAKRPCKYRITLKKLDVTDDFIDGDTFANEKDYRSLLKLITRSYIPFKKVDVDKISLHDGNMIMHSFLKE